MIRYSAVAMCMLSACGNSGENSGAVAADKAGAAASAPAPETTPAKPPASAQIDAAPSPGTPPSPSAPASSGPAFLDAQLGHTMTEFSFLGWTADGERFVLATMHGRYEPAETEPVVERDLPVMRMRVVYDALTQRAVAAFQVSNKLPPDQRGRYDAAWKEARPRAEWKAWVAANPLTKPKPATRSPDGAWRLKMKIARSSIHKSTKIPLKQRKGGFYYTWSPWGLADGDGPEDGDAPDEMPDPEEFKTIRPRWVLSSAKGKDTWKSIRYASPLGDDWNGGDPGRSIVGNMRTFWSPRGDQFLLVTFQKVDGDSDSSVMVAREAAFFLRTPGPQVAVRDGGVGAARLRAKVAELRAAGFPIQSIQKASKPAAQTVVYYRRSAKAAAERLAAKLDKATVKKLTDKGWLDVIIVVAK